MKIRERLSTKEPYTPALIRYRDRRAAIAKAANYAAAIAEIVHIRVGK